MLQQKFKIPFYYSDLQKERLSQNIDLPNILKSKNITLEFGNKTTSAGDTAEIQKRFPNLYGQKIIKLIEGEHQVEPRPLKVGVVLSGGPAPGGHNVIAGIFNLIKEFHPESTLIGFKDGPIGIIKNDFKKITEKKIFLYFNQGGFDMIGTGRDKIEKDKEFEAALKTVNDHKLDGLVVVGGDDSNTNAAVLAEYFKSKGNNTCVIGVPKTIDGDLKNEYIETSFGFDTCCKLYSEQIGNIMSDSKSAKKYFHICRVMGRSASHIALECALQTHPNAVYIGEDIEAKQIKLFDLVDDLIQLIESRFMEKKYYGVIIIPEGLIEFIPDMKDIIEQINHMFGLDKKRSWVIEDFKNYLQDRITTLESQKKENPNLESEYQKNIERLELFKRLPPRITETFFDSRDPHGNINLSKIETGKLLKWCARQKMLERKEMDLRKKFQCVTHFFGYEGRCGLPSNFDATYCYALGTTAAHLIIHKQTGVMSVVNGLTNPIKDWTAGAIPITQMLNLELRNEEWKPVIKKALVDLNGRPFLELQENLKEWRMNDLYSSLGPLQFSGESKDQTTKTIQLEQKK
ncbi:pyrophosphate--fructose 6-phosphate 1-phosphotransferase [Anaeramoeba ignava]|uniref:Pyrophosphate--fructose 6-phosphate 1-phosphotransferase n=1 Tax=Anaeramoeba ignava TaxID=1746090 RepID=A0A9Q0LRL3_ANAIG|nr:pyrophosphate--fructose 6-phosphate 1-phosphotransferase [Anaeramoeba ignava]